MIYRWECQKSPANHHFAGVSYRVFLFGVFQRRDNRAHPATEVTG